MDIEWSDEHIINGPSKDGYRLYRLEGFAKTVNRTQPSARGMICEYGNPDCNRCALGTLSQLTAENGIRIARADRGFGFKLDINWGLGSHVQGIARLPDWNGQGRMALTENSTGDGFHVAVQPVRGADEGAFSEVATLQNRRSFDLKSNPEYGNYYHPGGMQSQGDVVAVAMEEPRDSVGYSSVAFLRVTGQHIELINLLPLDGQQGEPHQPNSGFGAATAGFVRLEDGKYLAAVSGAKHGAQGIWFYESSGPDIVQNTKWTFRSFARPVDYKGAGGGLNFVTDCNGLIYLFAMTGTDGLGSDEETLQVFSIFRPNERVQIKLIHEDRDTFSLATQNHSFRWAGSVYVSKAGSLMLMNTERRTGGPRTEVVNGDVYMSLRSVRR